MVILQQQKKTKKFQHIQIFAYKGLKKKENKRANLPVIKMKTFICSSVSNMLHGSIKN